MNERKLLLVFFIFSTATLARCGLLEMSQMLWTKAVSGGLTKIGDLNPLRVPLIKVDQSEGDTSYRIILRNLEIVGLNESTLESVHVARGGLKSNLSELEAGYVSYSDLRDVESVRYRFHTMTREVNAPQESSHDAVMAPSGETADLRSRYQEDRRDRSRQNQQRFSTFEQSRQYDDRRPDEVAVGPPRGGTRSGSDTSIPGNVASHQSPVYHAESIYSRGTEDFQGNYRSDSRARGDDAADCEEARDSRDRAYPKSYRRFEASRQGADGGGRIADAEVSASEATGSARSKDRADARASGEAQPRARLDPAASGDPRETPEEEARRRPGYIDIVYAGDRANGSVRRFGNFGVEPREDRRVYGIGDVMKDIRESARFIVHNFTEGEALMKRNDMAQAAGEAKGSRDSMRYAKGHQEQQGYFEEGMQLIYHYGGMRPVNDTGFNDTRRAKRAHSKEAEGDVMHVILRIRVPLLRVRSQYTLVGKVGKEVLRGNGLFAGNFTDLTSDFTLELKRVNGELMIVRAARARLSARDQKITLQGMDEEGPVRAALSHGLTAAEAVAAMLADDFATKGLSEKTADAVIYRMYQDLPVN
ncbi:uncharacterized protein LOC105182682 [Harpegnathos saltator]|uniref:uncharacterized protein LOC105182682 n=1 Tax=Harpegnathos saltator TaxID=610380 RepID=UPI000948BD57|nr:uncharacterized protein LOC105182682 [Harpegnathos saltator]